MDVLLSTGEIVTSHAAGDGAAGTMGVAGDQPLRRAGRHRAPTTRYGARASCASSRSACVASWTPGSVVIVAGFQGITEEHGRHDARPRRLGHDGRRARRGAQRRRAARSTPTSTASTPPTRASCPDARKLTRHQLRGDAGAGQPGRARDAPARRRAGRRLQHPDPGRLELRRGARHADPRRSRSWSSSTGSRASPTTSTSPRSPIRGVPDRPGIAATLFEPLAEAASSVDTIVQNASVEGLTDLTFTVCRRPTSTAGPGRSCGRSPRRSTRRDVMADDAPRQGEHRRHRHAERARATPPACSAPCPTPASTSS